MRAERKNTVIFLGAGASKAEGAPIQSEMINEFFKLKVEDEEFFNARQTLITFLREVFGMDPETESYISKEYPKFEELLGVIDIALAKREAIGRLTGDLMAVREDFIYLLMKTLREKIDTNGGVHKRLMKQLQESGMLDGVTFISTNYDTLMDEAIATVGEVVYGFEPKGNPKGIKLYKLHGSLNWSECRHCEAFAIDAPAHSLCADCGQPRKSIIIPPKYNKNIRNAHLQKVWLEAERALAQAERLIICGYSFPDADINVKYLLKQGELSGKKLEINVVNGFAKKSKEEERLELRRYCRFFATKVNYTPLSFEDFVNNPSLLL